jgi:hypothetical protein
MRRFAKPLYGLTPVPRVRIPPSPPVTLFEFVESSTSYPPLKFYSDHFLLAHDQKLSPRTPIMQSIMQRSSGEHYAATAAFVADLTCGFRHRRFRFFCDCSHDQCQFARSKSRRLTPCCPAVRWQ